MSSSHNMALMSMDRFINRGATAKLKAPCRSRSTSSSSGAFSAALNRWRESRGNGAKGAAAIDVEVEHKDRLVGYAVRVLKPYLHVRVGGCKKRQLPTIRYNCLVTLGRPFGLLFLERFDHGDIL